MYNQICTVRNLSKSIKGKLIINNISFDILKGKITAIVGPNGAGKTTLMKLILGAVKTDSGQIRVLDDKIGNSNIRQQIGYVPEHLEFPLRSTPRHFLRYHCILNDFSFKQAENHVQEIAKIFKFESLLNRRFSTLSAGMQQKVRLAMGFLHKNLQFLLLDEPTINLDIITRQNFFEFILHNVQENGLTVFYSSHIFPEVKNIADYLLILNQGTIVGQYDYKNANKNYILRVNKNQLALELLGSNKFSTSLIHDGSLLLKLQPDQEPSDIIDLLRKHDIAIYSLTEDRYVEALNHLLKIHRKSSEKMVLEN